MIRKKKITIRSNARQLKTLRKKLRAFLTKSDFSAKQKWHFVMVVGEAVTNSIQHSYGKNGRGIIRVEAIESKDKMTFKIRDYGKKMNFKKIKSPKLPRRKPHGLGIYFIKTLMDELKYNNAHSKGNELTLIKYKRGAK